MSFFPLYFPQCSDRLDQIFLDRFNEVGLVFSVDWSSDGCAGNVLDNLRQFAK